MKNRPFGHQSHEHNSSMKQIKALASLVPAVILLGCSNPADNVPAASVSPASDAKSDAGGASESGGQTFAFGPESATIEFVGSKVTGSHSGGFQRFAGEFRVADGRLADSGSKVVIDMSSIWTDNNRVTGHLKNADFFDVPQFPTATFVSESVTSATSGSTVTGNLTLHGVTKKISFPANIQIGPDSVQVTAEFFLNRFDFDIKYPGKANDLIRKEVVLKLNVKATPGKADFASLENAAQAATATGPATSGPRGNRRRAE